MTLLQPASANTGKSGQTIFVLPAIPPVPSLNPAPALPIVTQPTLAVNGTQVALAPGPDDSAFWTWSLPVPVYPEDVLVLSAPAGWIAGYDALNLTVKNLAGQCEFTLPDATQTTMGVGLNMGGDLFRYNGPYCPTKNWYYRCSPWTNDSAVATVNADGNPTKLNGTIAVTAIFASASANSVDNLGISQLEGLYTLVWDSPDPTTDLSIITWGALGWPVTEVHRSPGVNGVGISRTYSVVKPTTPNPGQTLILNGPTLVLQLSHPQGSPVFSNVWIFPPGNKIDRSDPLAVEDNLIRQLQSSGKRGPAVLRWMDATAGGGGASSVVNPSELSNVAASSFVGKNNLVYKPAVTSIRPVDLTVSPTVQTIYGPKPIPGPDPAAMFFNCQCNGFFEVVCEQPHGISTGQYGWVAQPGNPIISLSFGGVAVALRAVAGLAWVTSPTTFILMAQNLNRVGVTNLDAPFTLLPGSYFQATINSGQCPHEITAKVTSEFEGCVLWTNIPILASNDTVDSIGHRILQNLGPTNRVAVELSNETWNNFVQYDASITMANILGTGHPPHAWYCQRSYEVFQRIDNIFRAAGRGNDVLHILAGQPGNMWVRVEVAASLGIKADIVTNAPYFDVPNGWATADANWTPAMVNDLVRHYLMLNSYVKLLMLADQSGYDDYVSKIGMKPLRWCYEGSIERLFPNIPSGAARTWDAMFHPDFKDTQKVFYSLAQRYGTNELTEYQCFGYTWSSGQSWWLYNWQGQPAGDGKSNQTIGAGTVFPPHNESVRAQAYKEWQDNWWSGQSSLTGWSAPPTSMEP